MVAVPVNLSAARDFPLPARVGRYELLAKIAEGGMASVYLGRLPGPMGFERPVAVKLMRPEYVQNADFVRMFLDEARLVARLSHPNIVQMLELGEDHGPIGQSHGGFYIVMECLMGESLLDVWYACQDRQIMLPYDVIAYIGARAAEGLHHAHELRDGSGQNQNIVHRDVTPGNVFITYDGQVKVIDFGVAKALNRLSAQTGYGVLKGKVAYMSPEQARHGQVDRRSDVFSLAVTLWELTTDRRLFKRKTDVDTIIAVSEAQVPDPTVIPDYPPALWAILRKALAKDPAQRYATAADFARDLEAFAQSMGRTVSAATLAEIMTYLFAAQKDRYLRWMQQASEGHAQGLFRAPDARKDALGMAGVDAMPLSKRSGHAMQVSAVEPPPPSPPTIRADFVSSGGAAPGARSVPPVAQSAGPAPIPAQLATATPAPLAGSAPAEGGSSKTGQLILLVIVLAAILGLGGLVVWSRSRSGVTVASTPSAPAPTPSAIAPPPPSIEALEVSSTGPGSSPSPSLSPSETPTGAIPSATTTTAREPLVTVSPVPTPPPDSAATAPTGARPKPSASPDDILKHRR
jgi:serine/threonine-protein kinase